jgi:alpha-glucuronidase
VNGRTYEDVKQSVETRIDETLEKEEFHIYDAEWWRNVCVGYFQQFSKRNLPEGVRPLGVPIDSVCWFMTRTTGWSS